MHIRFIEYKGDIFVSIGITYDKTQSCPECFVAIPIDSCNPNLYNSILAGNSIHIPFSEAVEITDKNRLISLMVLYGR